ncbi:hypothetical protein AJ78_05264 [Emergomyces pasteurianus Ep9510]|uniref:Uncharacterized protein n=1 Tax=Emergomyces pasteurianus Ep9510 TaxID=1447872 RepID=A0A1J9QGR9_9EURO|nr:hypothetical protein AJ78_05264 [Emergomyces pasteurianus Ep9510]
MLDSYNEGLPASTLALPNISAFSSQPKSEASASDAEIYIREIIPSTVNATKNNLNRRQHPELICYNSQDQPRMKWAANGRNAISEIGKKQDNIKGKSIYEVTRKFCSESHGFKFDESRGKAEKIYWFQNAWKNFPSPFVPVSIRVLNHGKIGTLDGKVCGDMMAKLISSCIAQKKSSLDHFRGGDIADGTGNKAWVYHIFCDVGYCLG